MRATLFAIGFVCWGITSAQNKPVLRTVDIEGERPLLKAQGLYGQEDELPPHIGNVFQLSIFENQLDAAVWFTQSPCLKVQNLKDIAPGNETGLWLSWDKLQSNCPIWLGLGIGWDNWAAKDLFGIVDSAAIEIRLKPKNGQIKGLPLAMALEDYGDKQAWTGFSPDKFEKLPISEQEWGYARFPLKDFEWQNSNASNLKQLIIQFEAAGEVVIDHIRLVRLPRKQLNQVLVPSLLSPPAPDFEPNWEPEFKINANTVAWMYTYDQMLYLHFDFQDQMAEAELRSLEMRLSGQSEPPATRKQKRLSDLIGQLDLQKTSDSKSAWTYKIEKRGQHMHLEVMIDLRSAKHPGVEIGKPYLFDFQLNYLNKGKSEFLHWNQKDVSINNMPDTWGTLQFFEYAH